MVDPEHSPVARHDVEVIDAPESALHPINAGADQSIATPTAASKATESIADSRRSSERSQRFSVPLLVSRVILTASALTFLHVIFAGTHWVAVLIALFSTLVFPIDGGGLGLATLLLILGVSLQRRKRVAWWLALILFGVMWFVAASFFALLVAEVVLKLPTDPPSDVSMSSYIFNVFSVGLLLGLLIIHSRDFMARTARGNITKALTVLAVGMVLTFSTGYLLSIGFAGRSHPRSRFIEMIRRLITGETATPGPGAPLWVQNVVGVLATLSMFAALLVLLRSQRARAALTLPDELTIRRLIGQRDADSLAYFATRRDKDAAFSENRQAAVTYRSQIGVCLAAGDPVGHPDHWPGAIQAFLAHARRYGYTPGVVGASEEGATAYTKEGLRALRVGDEAILRPERFDLAARDLRPVRNTVRKLEDLGYEVMIRRHADIPADEFRALIAHTDQWRDTDNERGFSMALGRLGDPLDGNCLMIQALFPVRSGSDDRTAGILSFVPWGNDGYSLDVMRRSPLADNGVTELMVTELMAHGRERGIKRVSLNFAVFRSALEEGSRVGATPFQRLQRRLLMVASRWWQIEQLYRSNVKYQPEWQPRFLCYEEASNIAGVGLAMGVAEGFIELPARIDTVQPQPVANPDDPLVIEFLAEQRDRAQVVERSRPEQVRQRLATRNRVIETGGEAYPASFYPSHTCAQAAAATPGVELITAGRVMALRDHGGVVFVRLQDWSGSVQVLLDAATLGVDDLREFSCTLSLGDHCGFSGVAGVSRNGTPSLIASSWQLTAKSLHPLPDKHKGMSDPEARVRQRYLDLIVNPEARHQLRARSEAIRAVRDTLQAKGFLEVETPILQTIHGGANARPFRTHINAYDLDLYLRIAPELFLKRLMVGGVDKVFEIGRNFRNEGADATHNPEFTMLEAYEAYGDYVTMRHVAQDIITNAAQAALGTTVISGPDVHGVLHEVDLANPWRVTTVNEAISAAAGVEITADTDRDALVALADKLDIGIDPRWTRGNVLLELYEHLVEHVTVEPTFYCDFPAEVSPLTRQHRDDPRLAERWDLVAFGAEVGTAYSELVDPVIQRERLTAQSLQAAGGDPEAMELDEAFLTALEYAMPPSGGLGMGLDRLVMMLTRSSIRETIAFPLVRPQRGH